MTFYNTAQVLFCFLLPVGDKEAFSDKTHSEKITFFYGFIKTPHPEI